MASAVMLMLLAACGGSPKDGSQIAAKVDSGEITVHQVEVALRSQPAPNGTPPEAAGRQALDSLIEQEIAAQAAHAEGLDHDPEVVQALELGRRDMLARLYRGRVATAVSPPSSDDVDRFFDANPALFERRRLYTIQELDVKAPAPMLPQLQALTQAARSAGALPESLRKAGFNVRARLTVRAAEDLSAPLLGAFATMGEGQSYAVPGADGAAIYTLVRAQDAPLDRATAREPIYTHILNDRRRAFVAERMQTLKAKAHVSYVGAFATPSAASVATAASQSQK